MKKTIASILLACMTVTTVIATEVPGDVNGDGRLSSLDIAIARKYILNGTATKEVREHGDMNGDGELSSLDLFYMRIAILGGIPKPTLWKMSAKRLTPQVTTVAGSVQSYAAEIEFDGTQSNYAIGITGIFLKLDYPHESEQQMLEYHNALGRVHLYDGDLPLNTGINTVYPKDYGFQRITFDQMLVMQPGTKKSLILREDILSSVEKSYHYWDIVVSGGMLAVNQKNNAMVTFEVIQGTGPLIEVEPNGRITALKAADAPTRVLVGSVVPLASIVLANGVEEVESGKIEFSVEVNSDIQQIGMEMALSIGDKIIPGIFIVEENTYDHIGTVTFDLTGVKIVPFENERMIILGEVKPPITPETTIKVWLETAWMIGQVSGNKIIVGRAYGDLMSVLVVQ